MTDVHYYTPAGQPLSGGLSAREIAETRARLTALSQALDSAVRIPGTSVRIGADAVLNLIPGIGTLAAKGLSSYLVYEARRLGVPRSTLLRMIGNVGADFALSAIPIFGWFGDIFFRANSRNIALLIAHLDRQDAKPHIVRT